MNRDRRTMLMAGLAASVPGVACGTPMSPGTPARLSLDGSFHVDEPTRAAAATDFGRLIHRKPDGVVVSASARDIAATLRWAAAHARRVAARGRGHSVFGRSQVSDGIVIDLARLRAIHLVRRDRIVVDAGATWSDVLAATLPHGLTPPVLTGYLHLSIGGTLAVGGVGDTTSRYGVQTDNVMELDVVTGDGRTRQCTPHRNGMLFDAVRAGLGQVAVISRATLRLVEAPRRVRRFVLTYPDLTTLLHDQRLLVRERRFHALQGTVVAAPTGGWTFRIDAATALDANTPDDRELLRDLSHDRASAQASTLAYFDYVNRFAALETTLRSNGQWFFPHPWLTTFVGDSAIASVVEATLAELTPADLGPFGQILLSAFDRRAVHTPLLQLPSENPAFAFNLIRVPATDSMTEAHRLVAANRALYERVRANGGTLYPVSAFPMSPEDWRSHFGAAFGLLSDAERKYDPAGILTPGYEVFEV
jgi:FAD/FMN-containing dehydrogenase